MVGVAPGCSAHFRPGLLCVLAGRAHPPSSSCDHLEFVQSAVYILQLLWKYLVFLSSDTALYGHSRIPHSSCLWQTFDTEEISYGV